MATGPAPSLDPPPPPVPTLIDVGPVRISTTVWEGGGPEPLLFVHGFGEGAYVWHDLIPRVRGERKAVAVDLRGHGDSSWDDAKRYSLLDHATDLRRVVERLGLGGVILVGHSMGAAIALRCLSIIGDQVAAMVLVEPPPPNDGPESGALAWLGKEEPGIYRDSEDYLRSLLERRPFGRPEILAYYARSSLREIERGRLTLKRDPVMEAYGPTREDAAHLSALRAPVLVVRGTASSFLSTNQASTLAGLSNHGRVEVVPAAGHAIMSENPRYLEQLLVAFLDGTRNSRFPA